MSNIKTAIIPAAGIGSRLGMDIPKTLLKYKEKTILEHHLTLLKKYEFDKIIYVLGYQEDLLLSEIKKYNPDVIIVRNENYFNTNTNYSISLCLDLLNDDEKFLTFDSDLIIEEEDFEKLISYDENLVIGVTSNISKNPVYIDIDNNRFNRDFVTNHEWANICILTKDIIDVKNPYVYQNFKSDYNYTYCFINCFDIDTEDDYKKIK